MQVPVVRSRLLHVRALPPWQPLNGLILQRPPGLDLLGVVILGTFFAFAALHQHPRWHWLAVVVRALMAADFLLAVADRFGVLGPAGAPGVCLAISNASSSMGRR
ncbi:MAG: hypothetical protein ACR2JG_06400 [Geodermatophilaceae bacterium]